MSSEVEKGSEESTRAEADSNAKCEQSSQESVPQSDSQVPTQGSSTDYVFDGSTYTYVDKLTNVKYKWDPVKSEWQQTTDAMDEGQQPERKNGDGVYGYENDTHTYTDPNDGTVYIWDREKSAWFPKVDDDFLAHYQMSYGFTDPNITGPEESGKDVSDSAGDTSNKKTEEAPKAEAEKGKGKGQQQKPPAWFDVDEGSNTKVYVSNLPLDTNETEFVEVMQKCGLVMKDMETNRMKVKLYTEPGTGQLKGDGLCSYIRKESVDLALSLLDGYELRGKKLRVERARFTMKGDSYDPSLKPKKRKKDKEKVKRMQERLFDWRPEKARGERPKSDSVVVVKNLFDPSVFDKDAKLILEYQQDLRDECQKCGAVKRVLLHDRHPEGVAQVYFKEPSAADACIQLLNGRWFGQRKITADTWDGKTKYKIEETEEQVKKRIENWDKHLQQTETEEDGK